MTREPEALATAGNEAGRALWMVAAILAIVLLVARLVSEGMFFDGLIYASVARNLSEGVGSLWNLQFSETLFPSFAEHPPLAFWLQGLLFRAFGDSTLVESGYCVLLAVISGLLIWATWRRLNSNDSAMLMASAMPLILAVPGSRLAWSYANNQLESLVIVFTGLAIFLIVLAYRCEARDTFLGRLPILLCAGLAIAAAVMTKGPVGLFPLAAIGLHWIAFGRPGLGAAIIDTVALLTALLGVAGFFWLWPEARVSLLRYVNLQVLASLSGARGSEDSGVEAVESLLRVLLIPMLITVGLITVGLIGVAKYLPGLTGGVKPRPAMSPQRWRNAAFLLLVALSASLPILVSPRINRFYFAPSVPFYGASFAIICAPYALQLMSPVREGGRRALRWTLAGGLVAALLFATAAAVRPGPDHVMLTDVRKLGSHLCTRPEGCDTIAVACPALWRQWALHGYLQRLYRISLARPEDATAAEAGDVVLTHSDCGAAPLAGYAEVDIGLEAYRLIRRSSTP